MPFARNYEYSEVRSMLQSAEGAPSPVTNQAGHSRTLHAMSVGGLNRQAQMHRVTKAVGESNNQFKARGGTGTTGAFLNKIQQGSAACEALNSPTGQAALAIFDDPAHSGKPVRITLEVAGVKEAGFLPGSVAPHATKVKKNDAAVQTVATTGVMLILDRGSNGASFQIQTCYPLNVVPCIGKWNAVDNSTKISLGFG